MLVLMLIFVCVAFAAERPNVVWITSEDHGPHMGCYGDDYADTPNVDRLAEKGLRYSHVWSTYPVCAAARTTIISGLYPMSTGGEHMRSRVAFPKGLKMYPQILRDAGYFCTNRVKTDYNFDGSDRLWDECSLEAHWKHGPEGAPFFAIFNSIDSHEGKVRTRKEPLVHDPEKVRIPAYHPDTEDVRLDWARYYDVVTRADAFAGRYLDELAEAGLMEDTVIFYYADHGAGLARSKRSACNSGLQVPMIVYIPEKFAHLRPPGYEEGEASDRLVDFVDLAPTLLSLVGIEPPDWMQGRAFLGEYQVPGPEYLFGGRGRMDERYDLVRCMTDGRYVYIRNYMTHRIPGQRITYMFATRTTRDWFRLHEEGKLKPEQEIFWQPKSPEELYDLKNDPDEVRNLAESPAHVEVLSRMRQAQRKQALRIRDLGFLPEGELFIRAPGVAPYDFREDDRIYPFERIFAMAELASSLDPEAVPALVEGLGNEDSAVRYWAANGLLMRGRVGVEFGRHALLAALEDDSPYVRITAAEALASYAEGEVRESALATLIELAHPGNNQALISLAALNSIDWIGDVARPLAGDIQAFSEVKIPENPFYDWYPPIMIKWLSRKFAE